MAASPSLRSPSHGRETSHTLRLAAGALLDNESVMLAVPEICTPSLSNGVVHNNLCGEFLIRARKVKGIFFASLKRTLAGERSKTTENQSAFGVLYFLCHLLTEASFVRA